MGLRSASSAPALPLSVTTDRIVIERSHHEYGGCWRADRLVLWAAKQILRALGMIVIASLFPSRRTRLI